MNVDDQVPSLCSFPSNIYNSKFGSRSPKSLIYIALIITCIKYILSYYNIYSRCCYSLIPYYDNYVCNHIELFLL